VTVLRARELPRPGRAEVEVSPAVPDTPPTRRRGRPGRRAREPTAAPRNARTRGSSARTGAVERAVRLADDQRSEPAAPVPQLGQQRGRPGPALPRDRPQLVHVEELPDDHAVAWIDKCARAGKLPPLDDSVSCDPRSAPAHRTQTCSSRPRKPRPRKRTRPAPCEEPRTPTQFPVPRGPVMRPPKRQDAYYSYIRPSGQALAGRRRGGRGPGRPADGLDGRRPIRLPELPYAISISAAPPLVRQAVLPAGMARHCGEECAPARTRRAAHRPLAISPGPAPCRAVSCPWR
jgi:hypothetical protein